MFASQGQSMIISARENAMHDLQCKVPTPHRNLVTSVRQIRAFGLPHTARPSHKERLAVIFEHEASSNTCASKSRCLLGDKTPSPHCQWASPLSWLGRGVVRRNGQSPQIHVETPGAAVRGRAGSLSRRIDRKLLGRPTAVPCGLSGCVRRAGKYSPRQALVLFPSSTPPRGETCCTTELDRVFGTCPEQLHKTTTCPLSYTVV